MGDLFARPKEPDLPKPKPPISPGVPGVQPITAEKKKPVGSTRSRTVSAGDLTPTNIFKKGTLG